MHTLCTELKTDHNYLVDVFRIVVMWWIVLFHYTTNTNNGSIFPFRFSDGGPVGVSLFFILSGYMMGSMYFLQSSFSKMEYIRYCVKRYFRFWPIYALSVILVYIYMKVFPVPYLDSNWSDFLINFLFIYHPGVNYVDGAHWFLAVLLIIQFFTASFMVIQKRYRIILLFVVFFLVVIIKGYANYSGIETNFGLIVLQSEAFLLFGLFIFMIKHRIFKYRLIYLVILGVCVEVSSKTIVLNYKLLIAIVFLLFVVFSRWNPPKLCQSSLVYLGNLSFVWYLVHQFIGYSIIYYTIPKGEISLFWLAIPCIITIMLSIFVDLLFHQIHSLSLWKGHK